MPRDSLDVAAKHGSGQRERQKKRALHNNVFQERGRVGSSGIHPPAPVAVRVGFPVLLSKSFNWERQEQAGWMGGEAEDEGEEKEENSTFGARQPICRLEQGHLICHSQPFE